MSQSNRVCKGTCNQFKAKQPVMSGRYAAGQYRCQTCEIYITKHGVNGYSCKCCNMRVRSKPRNSSSKKIYDKTRNNKVRNDKDPWINENDNVEHSKENTLHDSEKGKKSTPIYEEIDEFVKTYYELKGFLKTIKPQMNYQLVMLKELLEYGKLHRGEISESLAYFNNKNTTDFDSVKYYFDVSVYDELLKYEFVIQDEAFLDIPYYLLNVQLEEFQKIELIDFLRNEIVKHNQEHHIPENEFLNSNNRGNFDWTNSIIKDKLDVEKIENFLNNIVPNSTTSHWIWSVTPKNWEIIKSKNICGSKATKEKIELKIKSGDQVAFYVNGTNSFKGIFEFVGKWFDSVEELWGDDLDPNGSLKYPSRINLKPIQLGTVTIFNIHKKIKLLIGKPQNSYYSILQCCEGYPSNNGQPLLKEDFEIIKDHLVQNPLDVEFVEERSYLKNIKECPKCHTRVENSSNVIFESLVENIFGYRQFVSNDPQTKKPQLYCKMCSSQHTSQTIFDFGDKIENEISSTVIHICSKCNETKVEGIPGTALNNKMNEFFGFEFSYLTNSHDSTKPNIICRKCSKKIEREYGSKIKNKISDQVKNIPILSSDVTDVQIFNFDGYVLNIKNCKILSTNTIQKDQILTNDDLVSTFNVENIGGIRYTKKNDVIVLLSLYSNDHGDSIDIDSGLIIYTGEGKKDQKLKNGNEKILNSQNNLMVFFKEVYQEPGTRLRGALDNKYKFIGIVKYQKHYWKEEKNRQVLKFVLEIQS